MYVKEKDSDASVNSQVQVQVYKRKRGKCVFKCNLKRFGYIFTKQSLKRYRPSPI